ncbi:competence protein comGF [Bacillus sp. T33-2]|nr:competence protein comGF [Bacillus sp. T33-2]
MLFAFSIFCMVVSFLPLGIRSALEPAVMDSRLQRLEWEVFNSQVKKELRTAEKIMVQNEKLIMILEGQTILYERYGSNIRRRVDYSGHEILLQNIAEVRYEMTENGVEIFVEDQRGDAHSSTVRSFIDLEVVPL